MQKHTAIAEWRKPELDRIDEAESDFQVALELSEQQGNDNLKTFVEKVRELQRLRSGLMCKAARNRTRNRAEVGNGKER